MDASGGDPESPPALPYTSIRRRLLLWAKKNGRDFPWRSSTDPYRVLVSEIMLRKTQAVAVSEILPELFDRYPTVRELAAADVEVVGDVLASTGLRTQRGRQLVRMAELISNTHDGKIPRDTAALTALPGVGAYTAAAVRMVAFGLPDAAVDGNISRVLVRLTGIEPSRSEARKSPEIWELARGVAGTRGRTARNIHWALLDLAAICCSARSPNCGSCPLASFCSYAEDRPI